MKRDIKKRLYAVNRSMRDDFHELCALSNEAQTPACVATKLSDGIYRDVACQLGEALEQCNLLLGKGRYD